MSRRLLALLAVVLGVLVIATGESQVLIPPSGGGGAPTDAQYWTGAANATLSAEKNLGALSTGLVINTTGTPSAYAGSACGSGTDAVNSIDASGVVTCITPSGSGAPTDAKYIVQEANAGLSAEQSLGALTTGLTLNTVTGSTGVLSAYAGTSCTNQFPRSLSASGVATCASVSLTADITGDLAYSNLAQGTALSVLGVTGNATADNASIVAANDHEVLRRSGTAVAFGTVATAGIADAAVTYAKIQNVTDDRLLGRSSGSSGPPIEITVGSGLSLDGGALTATGGAGAATMFFTGMSTGLVATVGTTGYPMGRFAWATSSIDTRGIVPLDGTLSNLRVWYSAAQGVGDSCTFTVRSGATPDAAQSNTTLTCTMVDAVQGCTDTSNTPSVTGGHGLEIQLTAESGTCTGQVWFSFQFTAS